MKRAFVSSLALSAMLMASLTAQVRPGASGSPADTPQDTQKTTAIVLGRVVDATTGDPIPDAVVTLTGGRARGAGPGAARGGGAGAVAAGLAFAQRGGAPTPPNRQLTAGDGRFVFHDLAAGSYALSATAPGYLATFNSPGGGGAPTTITLAEGERRNDIKVRLSKPAVVSGTVVDEAGEPAVGVMVRAMRRSPVGGKVRYSAGQLGRTDDRGMYRITSLPPGDYVIAIPQSASTVPAATINSALQGMAAGTGAGSAFLDLAMSQGLNTMGGGVRVGEYLLASNSGTVPVLTSDGKLFVYQSLYYPLAPTPSQASIVKLGSGEDRAGVDFQLRLLPSARISGTVTGPSGPTPNVNVRLLPAGEDVDTDADVANAQSAADGSFAFLGVPAGRYVVRVVKPPRQALPAGLGAMPMVAMVFGEEMTRTSPQDALMLFGETPVSLGATDIDGLAVSLAEGVKLSGRLVFDGATAPPPQLQSLVVFVSPADPRTPSEGGGRQDRPDDQGQFKTAAYPPGKYFVAAGPPQNWIIKSVTAGGRDIFNAPLELKDADVGDIVITYTDKPAQVTGTVADAAGTKSTSATAYLFPSDYRAWIANGMNQRRARSVRTSSTGSYTAASLLAGDYLIAAIEDGDPSQLQDPAFIDAIARLAQRITIGEGDKRTLDLQLVKVPR
jgi:hypothetical protein